MTEPADRIAALINALESSDKPTIRAAVDALIPLAQESPEIASKLTQLLNEPDRASRWPIAYVLANLPGPSETTVQVLIESLDTNDSDIRWAIALLLIQLARKDQKIITRLLETVSKGTPAQRRMAVYCIRDLKLADSASLRALLDSLCDSDPGVRVAAVTSFKTRSDVGRNEEKALLRLLLEDPDGRVKNAAAITLAQLGAAFEEFLTALERASSSQNWQLRKAANAALELIKKKIRSNR
jgi:HEAT repeat protein